MIAQAAARGQMAGHGWWDAGDGPAAQPQVKIDLTEDGAGFDGEAIGDAWGEGEGGDGDGEGAGEGPFDPERDLDWDEDIHGDYSGHFGVRSLGTSIPR